MVVDPMTRSQAILKAGPYYHASDAKNIESIASKGLVPSGEMYEVIASVKEPIVCVAPLVNKSKYIAAIASNSDTGRVVLFEIDSDFIANARCEIDCTNTELASRITRLGTNDFASLLADGADLMCFDTIPPNVIRQVPVR